MVKVLMPLAQGCEELEAVTIIDLLRRAGIEVVTAGLQAGPVTASRGTVLVPDRELAAVLDEDFDMIVLPGGQPGSRNLGGDPRVIRLLQKMAGSDRFTCAICAAPSVLAKSGLLEAKQATAYPGALDDFSAVQLSDAPVVSDGKIITSRGPGTAMDFALTLIENLLDSESRQKVEAGLVRA